MQPAGQSLSRGETWYGASLPSQSHADIYQAVLKLLCGSFKPPLLMVHPCLGATAERRRGARAAGPQTAHANFELCGGWGGAGDELRDELGIGLFR